MASLNHCATVILSRGEPWQPGFATEPYEAGWAREAVIFLNSLDQTAAGGEVAVQISPDGILWVDEGTRLVLPHRPGELAFAKLAHFGQFLRLVARGEDYPARRIMATMCLK